MASWMHRQPQDTRRSERRQKARVWMRRKRNGASIDASIIIVNYITSDLACECLRSVYQQTHDAAFKAAETGDRLIRVAGRSDLQQSLDAISLTIGCYLDFTGSREDGNQTCVRSLRLLPQLLPDEFTEPFQKLPIRIQLREQDRALHLTGVGCQRQGRRVAQPSSSSGWRLTLRSECLPDAEEERADALARFAVELEAVVETQ